MRRSRQTIRRWLLAALLERGCDDDSLRSRPPWRRPRAERTLTPAECRERLGPYSGVRFLPRDPGGRPAYP